MSEICKKNYHVQYKTNDMQILTESCTYCWKLRVTLQSYLTTATLLQNMPCSEQLVHLPGLLLYHRFFAHFLLRQHHILQQNHIKQ